MSPVETYSTKPQSLKQAAATAPLQNDRAESATTAASNDKGNNPTTQNLPKPKKPFNHKGYYNQIRRGRGRKTLLKRRLRRTRLGISTEDDSSDDEVTDSTESTYETPSDFEVDLADEESESEEDKSEPEDEPKRPPKKQKTVQEVVEVIDLVTAAPSINSKTTSPNQHKRKRGETSKPTKKKHGIKTMKIPKRKLICSEDRPRNDAERDVLKKDRKDQTIMAFLNFPPGRKTNTTMKVKSNLEAIPKKTTLPKSSCKVSRKERRGTYKKYDDDPSYVNAMEVGMQAMFDSGGECERGPSSDLRDVINHNPTINIAQPLEDGKKQIADQNG